MAKSLLSVKSAKKPRKTKNENYLVNKKYYGDEPKFSGPVSDMDLASAFSWYNVMHEESDAREYITDYFKANKLESSLKQVRRVPYNRLPLTYIWVLRISMRGAQLDRELVSKAIDKIKESAKYAEKEETVKEAIVDKPTIQDRIAEKLNDIIGDIENIVDNPPKDFSMYKYLQSKEIPAMMAVKIADYYRPIAAELAEALIGKDEQLKEGYSHFTKAKLRERIALFAMIVEDSEKYSGNIRKQRAPRKKKAVSAEKKLKHFKYQQNDNAMKLSSVNPESIIGAQELWTFNTKYKTLTLFKARGPAGLDVNRASITGYDVDNSQAKKIGRKTEDTINKVLNGGKIVLRKIFDELKSDKVKVTDRININTILLKVVK